VLYLYAIQSTIKYTDGGMMNGEFGSGCGKRIEDSSTDSANGEIRASFEALVRGDTHPPLRGQGAWGTRGGESKTTCSLQKTGAHMRIDSVLFCKGIHAERWRGKGKSLAKANVKEPLGRKC